MLMSEHATRRTTNIYAWTYLIKPGVVSESQTRFMIDSMPRWQFPRTHLGIA